VDADEVPGERALSRLRGVPVGRCSRRASGGSVRYVLAGRRGPPTTCGRTPGHEHVVGSS
jgi:hypothetical protein